jgi:hypothetical protein
VHLVADFEKPPVGPIASMSEDDFARFVNHMLWFVLDEVEPLWSVLTPPSTPARSQPSLWPPPDVSRLFLTWFDAGLLKIVRGTEAEVDVPSPEARSQLADTDKWQAAAPDSVVRVAGTSLGRQTADSEWLAVARSLRSR